MYPLGPHLAEIVSYLLRGQLGPSRYIQKQTHRRHQSKHGGASGTDEGQRKPFRGRQSHHHGDIHQGLGGYEQQDPDRHIQTEPIRNTADDPESVKDQTGKQEDHKARAQKAQFLPDDGKNKINTK